MAPEPFCKIIALNLQESTHAPQALELLNGQLSNGLARFFADRLRETKATDAERVELAWKLATGRAPTAQEKRLALGYLAEKPGDALRLKELALDVMNLNSFLYEN